MPKKKNPADKWVLKKIYAPKNFYPPTPPPSPLRLFLMVRPLIYGAPTDEVCFPGNLQQNFPMVTTPSDINTYSQKPSEKVLYLFLTP